MLIMFLVITGEVYYLCVNAQPTKIAPKSQLKPRLKNKSNPVTVEPPVFIICSKLYSSATSDPLHAIK